MAKFPNCSFSSFVDFHQGYQTHLRKAQDSVDVAAVAHAARLIEKAIKDDRTIFVCGNGGSSAIANHLEVDYAKGIATRTTLRPKVVSLCRLDIITAYANDVGYWHIFQRQLEQAARPGDVLIAMSASGNSQNVTRAVTYHDLCIVMTGFPGGALANRVVGEGEMGKDVLIRVDDSENYGICEDVFQHILVHEIPQFIRQSNMDPDKIKETKF